MSEKVIDIRLFLLKSIWKTKHCNRIQFFKRKNSTTIETKDLPSDWHFVNEKSYNFIAIFFFILIFFIARENCEKLLLKIVCYIVWCFEQKVLLVAVKCQLAYGRKARTIWYHKIKWKKLLPVKQNVIIIWHIMKQREKKLLNCAEKMYNVKAFY